jgi:hypothetical protein
MKRFILIITTIFISVFDSFSQDQWDSSIPETLFLGRTVDDYLNTIKGSMYVFSDFQEGKIKYVKGDYSGVVLMNINAHLRELNVKKTTRGQPLALDLNFISEVHINDSLKIRRFRKLSSEQFEKGKADTFLYELLYDSVGITLIREDVILFNKAESGAYSSGSKEDEFITSTQYYLSKKNGLFISTNLNKGSIQRNIGSEIASSIDSYIKKNNLSWKIEADFVQALIAIGVE